MKTPYLSNIANIAAGLAIAAASFACAPQSDMKDYRSQYLRNSLGGPLVYLALGGEGEQRGAYSAVAMKDPDGITIEIVDVHKKASVYRRYGVLSPDLDSTGRACRLFIASDYRTDGLVAKVFGEFSPSRPVDNQLTSKLAERVSSAKCFK